MQVRWKTMTSFSATLLGGGDLLSDRKAGLLGPVSGLPTNDRHLSGERDSLDDDSAESVGESLNRFFTPRSRTSNVLQRNLEEGTGLEEGKGGISSGGKAQKGFSEGSYAGHLSFEDFERLSSTASERSQKEVSETAGFPKKSLDVYETASFFATAEEEAASESSLRVPRTGKIVVGRSDGAAAVSSSEGSEGETTAVDREQQQPQIIQPNKGVIRTLLSTAQRHNTQANPNSSDKAKPHQQRKHPVSDSNKHTFGCSDAVDTTQVPQQSFQMSSSRHQIISQKELSSLILGFARLRCKQPVESLLLPLYLQTAFTAPQNQASKQGYIPTNSQQAVAANPIHHITCLTTTSTGQAQPPEMTNTNLKLTGNKNLVQRQNPNSTSGTRAKNFLLAERQSWAQERLNVIYGLAMLGIYGPEFLRIFEEFLESYQLWIHEDTKVHHFQLYLAHLGWLVEGYDGGKEGGGGFVEREEGSAKCSGLTYLRP